MKVIIDIPKQMYLYARTGYLCGSDIIVRAIKNGTPLALEQNSILDKIKAEILDLDDTEYDFEGYYKGITDAVKIIDKYKAESESE